MIWETRSAASSTEDGLVFFVDGSNRTWKVWTAGAAKIIGNIDDVAADTWYHTVVARSSGTTTLYVNGVSIGTFSDSYNYSNDDLRIGKNISSDNRIGFAIRYISSDTEHKIEKSDSGVYVCGQKNSYFVEEKRPKVDFGSEEIKTFEKAMQSAGAFGNKKY